MFLLLSLQDKEAQTPTIRHTVHHKPQVYTGSLRLSWAASIILVLLVWLIVVMCGYRALCFCAPLGLHLQKYAILF